MIMPPSELKDPEDREATGTKVRFLYCPDCSWYSGGGVCRVCERGYGEFTPPVPPAVRARKSPAEQQPFVAIVCSRGRGSEVVWASEKASVS